MFGDIHSCNNLHCKTHETVENGVCGMCAYYQQYIHNTLMPVCIHTLGVCTLVKGIPLLKVIMDILPFFLLLILNNTTQIICLFCSKLLHVIIASKLMFLRVHKFISLVCYFLVAIPPPPALTLLYYIMELWLYSERVTLLLYTECKLLWSALFCIWLRSKSMFAVPRRAEQRNYNKFISVTSNVRYELRATRCCQCKLGKTAVKMRIQVN